MEVTFNPDEHSEFYVAVHNEETISQKEYDAYDALLRVHENRLSVEKDAADFPVKRRKYLRRNLQPMVLPKDARVEIAFKEGVHLPNGMDENMVRDAMTKILKEEVSGGVYQFDSWTRFENGTTCLIFSTGICPIHKRLHMGTAKFEYKIGPKRGMAGWKCFRDNSWKKAVFSDCLL